MLSDYYDLGGFGRPISTTSAEAQTWFDRGLVWCYGFNHEEAVRCFQRAVELDPDCAMAHWGIAYATGPTTTRTWVAFDAAELVDAVAMAHAAVATALSLSDRATPLEQALIEALQHRFPEDTPAEDCAPWNDAYAAAMRDVYPRFGDDLDVATLVAEALMGRTPWQLWDLRTGAPAEGADTQEALDGAGAGHGRRPRRPTRVCCTSTSTRWRCRPTRSGRWRAADRLRGLVPDAGHLEHMPTHIDVLCGQYRDVVGWNQTRRSRADRKYLEREGRDEFLLALSLPRLPLQDLRRDVSGTARAALEAADELIATLPEETAADRGAADGRLGSRGSCRCGCTCWCASASGSEIVDEPLPADRELYCMTTAMLHYAKGVAFGATGRRGRGRASASAVRRGRHPCARERATCSTTPASTSSRSRPRC